MPFTAEEMRERFPNPGDLVDYLNAEDARNQPATEPWLHAMVRSSRPTPEGGGAPYPNCCCADTHLQFQRRGNLYLLGGGVALWGLWRLLRRKK